MNETLKKAAVAASAEQVTGTGSFEYSKSEGEPTPLLPGHKMITDDDGKAHSKNETHYGRYQRKDVPYEVDEKGKPVVPASIRAFNVGATWPDLGDKKKNIQQIAWPMGGHEYAIQRDKDNNKLVYFPNAQSGAAATIGMWEKYSKSVAEGGHAGQTLLEAVGSWTGHTGGPKQVQAYAEEIAAASGGKIKTTDKVGPWLFDFIQTPEGLAFLKKQADEEAGWSPKHPEKRYPLDDAGYKAAVQQWLDYSHPLHMADSQPWSNHGEAPSVEKPVAPIAAIIPAKEVMLHPPTQGHQPEGT